MTYVNSIGLVLVSCIALLSLGIVWKKGVRAQVGVSEYIGKYEKILFFLLFLFGLVIRIVVFPAGFSQDEAMAAFDAKSLLMHGYDHHGISWPVHMYAWGTSEQSAFLIYYLIPFIKLFGMSETSVRVAAAILSMIGAIFLSLIARKAFGREMGIVTLVICIFNPWHFVQSHFALDCNSFPHLFVIGFYLLFMYTESRKVIYLYLGILLVSLSQYGYAIALYSVPAFLVFTAVYLYCKKIVNFREIITSIVIFFASSGALFATMILNVFGITEDVKIGPFTLPAFVENERASDMLFFADDKIGFIIRNIKEIFRFTIMQKESVPWDNVEYFGTVFVCMVPLAVLGFGYTIYKIINKDEKIHFYVLLIFWFVMCLFAGLITDLSGLIRRFNIYFYLEILFIVIAIQLVVRASKKLFLGIAVIYLSMGALLFTCFCTVYQDGFYAPEASSRFVMDAAYRMKDIDCEKYYITPDTLFDDAKRVTEIWVLFAFDIDSDYVLGKNTESYNRQFNNFYKDQFVYDRASDIGNIDADNAYVYFINGDDKKLFDNELFDSYAYGSFFLIIPKWMNG